MHGEWNASTGAEFDVVEMTEAELLAAEQLGCDALVFPAITPRRLPEPITIGPMTTARLTRNASNSSRDRHARCLDGGGRGTPLR